MASEPVNRRNILKQTAAVAAGACLASCATNKVPGSTPKQEAQYQDRPHGLERCGLCKHFIPNNACEIVAAPVQANGWCKFYALF